MDEEAFFEDRDAFLDAVEAQVDERLPGIFGSFISALSDNPSDAALDIIILLLITETDRLVASVPDAARARELGVNPGTAPEAHAAVLRSYFGSIAAELATKAAQMAAEGQTGGLRAAVLDILERKREAIVAQVLTSVMAFERTVLGATAPEGSVYVYAGPRDKKNRTFCRSVLDMGVAFRRATIETLNAHPDLHAYVPPNVFSLCGGVNCRHMFFPVPEAAARDRGLNVV